MKYDVVIVGAGAAGLCAAYWMAVHCKSLHIVVIEKEKIPGRKLKAAGNGKCNLTNAFWSETCYHTESFDFAQWVNRHSYKEITTFFSELGVLLYEQNGYYYPYSNQGKQVTNLVYERCCQNGVDFMFECTVKDVQMHGIYSYTVTATDEKKNNYSVNTKQLLMAAGGSACPKLGGGGSGYGILKALSIKDRRRYPVLCPIYVEDTALSVAKGVRLDCNVSLKLLDGKVMKEQGQVQFNENSLSGIVIMNLSCYYNQYSTEEAELFMDTIPALSWEELKKFFIEQSSRFPKETIQTLLCGLYPEPFTHYILKRLQLHAGQAIEDYTDKQWNRLTSVLKKLTFTPVYREEYDKAQATGGGILLSEVSLDTFESNCYKGLYIVGELLDVAGKCGGYNLSFAILSGLDAAAAMIKSYEEMI